jgi:hypothetical protein
LTLKMNNLEAFDESLSRVCPEMRFEP